MKNRSDWLNLILFAALVALFFWRILTPNPADRQSFPPGDFYAQFWAFTIFDARELGVGRLPLWNPYTFAGAPFWADVQSAVFYPFSLLTLALSAPWGFSAFALELEAVAHFWLAATFMYLFVRQVTGSRAAAVFAAVTFTFSGYLTGYPSQQLAVLEVDVWLPLILYLLARAFPPPPQPAAFRPLLLAGAALGIALLAGHPQSYLIVTTVSAAWLLFLAWPRRTPLTLRHALNAGGKLALFLLTGLALAAIQFIPAAEYTLRSVRAAGTYPTMSGGFPITDLIQIVLPGQVSLYSPLYVGMLGLLLAVWVVFAAPNRHTIFWGLAAGVSLLITFGGNTFLYSPLYLWVPGFSIFRGQERWAFATAFSLSVLAGYGFYQLTINNEQLSRNGQAVARLAKYFFFFALLLALAFFFGLNSTGWSVDSPFYGLLGAAILLALLSALAWLLLQLAPRLPPVAFAALAVALVCFDLFSVNWQTNLYPQPPEWHTQLPAAVQAIRADATHSAGEPFRVYNEFRLYDNYGVPFELQDLWGASPLRPARYDEFLAPPMPIERTWELLNVKYVITWRQELFVPSDIIFQEPAADGTTYVHRLKTVGPRAWLVNQAQTLDDSAILQTLADPNFDRRTIALLEPGSNWTAGESAGGGQLAVHSSQFPAPGRIIHQISADAPALLLLSEPHYPGWQATVDGQPAPVLRADYVLRAVPVPAGQHTVELTFRPASFTVGAVVSGLALLTLAGLLLVRNRRSGGILAKNDNRSGLR